MACWLLIIIAVAILVPLQRGIDRRKSAATQFADVLYLRSARRLRMLSVGHEGLLADVYWTRVVQYFGRRRLAHSNEYQLLGPLLRITTELDPHLIIAYRFGAIFLGEKPPAGAGDPQEALELLRRGIVANPDYWRLWQDLGFVYYWDLKDYPSAARAFEAGSERPDAMPWMKAMAASVAAKGGETVTSRLLWSELERHAENDQLRLSAQEHLAAMAAREQIVELDAVLRRYRQSEGRAAQSWQEVAAAGLIAATPRDPGGVPYVIGADGRAHLAPESRINLRLLE
jgi:tetratricopeptide (TPR) repeat protein